MINQDFVDFLNSGSGWALVGSGPSTASGMASWSTATERLPTFLPAAARAKVLADDRWMRLLTQQDFPAALGIAEEFAGRDHLLNAFNRALGTPAAPSDAYHRIVQWPLRNYVTTNYDSLLFSALRRVEPTAQHIENTEAGLALMTREPSNLVLRIHGDLTQKTTTVLTKRDYDRSYGPGGRIGELSVGLFKDRRFVIVGFGFNDADLLRVLRLASDASNPAKPHFAIIGLTDAVSRRHHDLSSEFGLVVIPYRIPDDGSHDNLGRLLSAYEWCILGRSRRRDAAPHIPSPQSTAVGALTLANECLTLGDPTETHGRQVIRSHCLSVLRARAQTISQVSQSLPETLPLQSPRTPTLHAMCEHALNELTTEGLVALADDDNWFLTPAGVASAEAAVTEGRVLADQFRLSVASRASERSTGDAVSAESATDCVVRYLDESCVRRAIALGQVVLSDRPQWAQLHRANVLSEFSKATAALATREAGLIAIEVIGQILSSPSEAERRYLGRLLQASFAVQLLGLEPDSLQARREALKTTLFLVDSNVLVAYLATASIGNAAVIQMLKDLAALKGKFGTTAALLRETATHAEWARQRLAEYGDTGPEILDILEGRNGFRPNLFIGGFVESRAARPGLTSKRYFAECFSGAGIGASISPTTVLRALSLRPEFTVVRPPKAATRVSEAADRIKEKRLEKGTFRSESQVAAEAEVVTLVDASASEELTVQRVMFVSNTRVLDGLPNFHARVTIDAAAVGHWVAALRPSATVSSDREQASFESMIHSLYEEGITLFDRAQFRKVFDPVVSAAEERFAQVANQHRDLVEEILGPDAATAFAEIGDLAKPMAMRVLDSRILGKVQDRLRLQEEALKKAQSDVRLSKAERDELNKLRAKQSDRRRRASRRRASAMSRKQKRRRRD